METTSTKRLVVYIDGTDGSGKTSAIKTLKEKYPDIEFKDRGVLTKITLSHWSLWEKPETLVRDWDFYILFETTIEEARRRILLRQEKENIPEDKWETVENLFMFRHRFRTLAGFYGDIHYVDVTTNDFEQNVQTIEDIIFKKTNKHYIPCIQNFSEEEFEKLPKVVEGESKIVRNYNEKFHIVKYKPSVHSHKMQRSGMVDGTDKERMIMTRDVLDIFSRHQITHTYWAIGEKYILTENLDPEKDIPILEVIVKRCFVGSDKHRYFEMEKLKNRFGKNVVDLENNREYQKLLVRFDYRNPNFHPETKVPIGDILVCDDLADEFMDVEKSKKTVLSAFKCLDYHFSKMNVYFQDVCFMVTTSGDKIFGEVSQDCGRYKYMKEDELTDLDKDVWRAGGSSELVVQKYQMLTKLVSDHVLDLYEKDKVNY